MFVDAKVTRRRRSPATARCNDSIFHSSSKILIKLRIAMDGGMSEAFVRIYGKLGAVWG
jgi:hypothetical protein